MYCNWEDLLDDGSAEEINSSRQQKENVLSKAGERKLLYTELLNSVPVV